jgi:hypothetical protein
LAAPFLFLRRICVVNTRVWPETGVQRMVQTPVQTGVCTQRTVLGR